MPFTQVPSPQLKTLSYDTRFLLVVLAEIIKTSQQAQRATVTEVYAKTNYETLRANFFSSMNLGVRTLRQQVRHHVNENIAREGVRIALRTIPKKPSEIVLQGTLHRYRHRVPLQENDRPQRGN